jgi:hypothetical protein
MIYFPLAACAAGTPSVALYFDLKFDGAGGVSISAGNVAPFCLLKMAKFANGLLPSTGMAISRRQAAVNLTAKPKFWPNVRSFVQIFGQFHWAKSANEPIRVIWQRGRNPKSENGAKYKRKKIRLLQAKTANWGQWVGECELSALCDFHRRHIFLFFSSKKFI